MVLFLSAKRALASRIFRLGFFFIIIIIILILLVEVQVKRLFFEIEVSCSLSSLLDNIFEVDIKLFSDDFFNQSKASPYKKRHFSRKKKKNVVHSKQ